MIFRKLTIRFKLLLAFGFLIAMLAVICANVINQLNVAKTEFENYINGISLRTTTAHLVHESIDARAIAARNLVLVSSPDDVRIEKAAVEKAVIDVRQRMASLQELAQQPGMSKEAKERIADMARIESQYEPVALDIVGKALNGDREAAIDKMNKECRPLLAALVKAADAYNDFNSARSQELVEEAKASYEARRWRLLVTCLLVIAIAVVSARAIIVAVMRPLEQSLKIVTKIATGDLTGSISTVNQDEFGRLLDALRDMQGNLVRLVYKVRQGSESVSVAIREIAQGNQDLSARTESQASALEETATSMEQLGATVHLNADNANKANHLARDASIEAQQGGKAVSQVVETMRGISQSSGQIADIINVIDAIAFQTNILALNAAVEAARAGESGRGFSVVAAEVRLLAQRSAESAKQIKALITENVERVGSGMQMVNSAGATMNELVASIRRVTEIVGEISSASGEQSNGVSQVGEAVGRMEQTTRQNAALVEQITSASMSLSQQTMDLMQAVSAFKLADEIRMST